MNAPNSSAQARAWRRRTAAVFAAVGALIFSSGLVMITAPAANAQDKINVCHRSSSDNHPYVFQRVAMNSAAYNAHMDHRVENSPATAGEDKYWKSDGVWNGIPHQKGDFKPDYIEGVDPQMAVGADAARDWCLSATPTATLANLDITRVGACGTYGAITKPEDDTYVAYTINQPAWNNLSGTVVVTATLQNGAVGFKGSTNGWVVADDELSATRSVDVGQFTACPSGTLATPEFESIDDCGEYGWITEPSSTNVEYTIDGGENWNVESGTHTVTATLVNGATSFANAPAGWVVSGTTATYTVVLGSFEECPEGVLVDVVANEIKACGTYGSVTRPADSSTVRYSITGGAWTGLQGQQTVTATLTGAATAFDAASLAGWTLSADKKSATRTFQLGTYTECVSPTVVTPLAPTWGEADCDNDASVTYTAVEGVEYSTTGQVAAGKTATVKAKPLGNNVFAQGAVTSWSHTFAAAPTDCEDPTDPTDPQVVLVSPEYPSAGKATCSRDGRLKVPGQPAGVLMTQTGSAPGDVTFTFAPAEGYAFPEGTDTEVVVTVPAQLTGELCLLGEGVTKPKPKPRDRGPVVLGSHAAVPTAVAAGVAGLPTSSVSPIGSPRLAQALVVGGLLMLIAGGSMGLGRRTRGVHES